MCPYGTEWAILNWRALIWDFLHDEYIDLAERPETGVFGLFSPISFLISGLRGRYRPFLFRFYKRAELLTDAPQDRRNNHHLAGDCKDQQREREENQMGIPGRR